MANLSSKDLGLIGDLMNYEQLAAKKAKEYSESLTDCELVKLCKTLEQNHNKNFDELYKLL